MLYVFNQRKLFRYAEDRPMAKQEPFACKGLKVNGQVFDFREWYESSERATDVKCFDRLTKTTAKFLHDPMSALREIGDDAERSRLQALLSRFYSNSGSDN